jgi:hypothetical protein
MPFHFWYFCLLYFSFMVIQSRGLLILIIFPKKWFVCFVDFIYGFPIFYFVIFCSSFYYLFSKLAYFLIYIFNATNFPFVITFMTQIWFLYIHLQIIHNIFNFLFRFLFFVLYADFILFYSYVHRYGSFLPSSPQPSLKPLPHIPPLPLATWQKLFCPYL